MKFVFTILLLGFAFSAYGHGDEDHGAAPPIMSQAVAPRAVATSEDFEVVAILDRKRLVIYVDQFDSNEPITKAKIEIEGARFKGIANETAAGVYVINVPSLTPAKYPITISIESGETSDLLTATLDISSAPSDIAPHVSDWKNRSFWLIAGLLTLVSAALFIARHHKKAKGV
jgi:hypothetical protein